MRKRSYLPDVCIAESVDNEFLDLSEKCGSVVRVSFKLDRLGKVEAEYTHDGFRVNRVSSRNKVNVIVALRYDRNKVLDVVDST